MSMDRFIVCMARGAAGTMRDVVDYRHVCFRNRWRNGGFQSDLFTDICPTTFPSAGTTGDYRRKN